MTMGLDVIVLDDDTAVCEMLTQQVKRFYGWGDVISFDDSDEAIAYCLSRKVGLAIFIVDVFLGGKSGFFFLDAIEEKFPTAHQDAIVITGNASEDVVNMCVASDVTHLLEKPVKYFALQLAVRSLVAKYLTFSKRLLQDPDFAAVVAKM